MTRKLEFNRDVRPILSDKCFKCHGPDSAARQAMLRLDLREDALAEHDGGKPIVPGKAEQSEVVRRIEADDDEVRMPPRSSDLRLTKAEIAVLRRWVAEGAEYQPHWSLVLPKAAPLPAVKINNWGRNGIDRFTLAVLERERLSPSGEADKRTQLRRVTLALTGLPPTLAELDAFLADTSPQAYENVVDRLLRSPCFGERMALDWLDAARYADTNGYFTDAERVAWPWREWVIGAFNANLPFDRFTIEQFGGRPLARRDDCAADRHRIQSQSHGHERNGKHRRGISARLCGRSSGHDRDRVAGTHAGLCSLPRSQI